MDHYAVEADEMDGVKIQLEPRGEVYTPWGTHKWESQWRDWREEEKKLK